MEDECEYGEGLLAVLHGNEQGGKGDMYRRGVEDGRELKRTNRYAEYPVRCVVCDLYCSELFEQYSKLNIFSLEGYEDKFVGTMLGGAIGDAMGFPFEGRDVADVGEVTEFVRTLRTPKGTYSDDTELMLLAAECLGEDGRFDVTAFERKLVAWYNGNPRTPGDGVIRTVKYLEEKKGEDPKFENIGNGAITRVVPVTLANLADDRLREAYVLKMVRCTHKNDEVDSAALAMSGLTKYLTSTHVKDFVMEDAIQALLQCLDHYENGFVSNLDRALNMLDKDYATSVQEIGTGALCRDSVVAAIYTALYYYEDFEKGVLAAAGIGGDCDTIAALVGQLLGGLHGAKVISMKWVDELENQDYIVGQGLRLEQIAKLPMLVKKRRTVKIKL